MLIYQVVHCYLPITSVYFIAASYLQVDEILIKTHLF